MSFSLLLEITLTVTLNFIRPPEWSDGTGSAQRVKQCEEIRQSMGETLSESYSILM